ncbi:class I adenylate-forming enzyme family protein [Nocardia vinacea]|uniref:class I adenylate-forming enzyme family protein n=1 Tax=Nocardia vinacea TaxID=96468 RepID=UPI0002FDEFA3|nr:class I adenylate-forming enzyme family protein [Nocardia vinacea]
MLHTNVIVPIPQLLAKHADERPDQIAFRDPRQAVTYSQLDSRTARLAGHLIDLGLRAGDRLLMYLDNCVEVAEGYLVAPRADVITVCTNPSGTRYELEQVLRDSGAVAVLTDGAHLPTVLGLIDSEAPDFTNVNVVIVTGPPGDVAHSDATTVVFYDDLIATEPAHNAPDSTPLDAWCWMLYTSGTTGRPKGVRLSQRSCLWVVGACWVPIAGLTHTDMILSALPLFHSYALVLCVLGVAATGASARLLPRFSPSEVLSALAEDNVTFVPGVPTMFRYLMNSATDTRLVAPALRLCVSAGALMPTALNETFEEFAGVPLLDGYGITETSTMVTMNSPTGGRVRGSCGLPLPGLTVRLIDPATGTDAAPGDEGELWVQGPNVMLGYHNLPEATADVLTHGWYHTGDLARRDENGFIRISGRVKELIIRGGENIYPAEIEDILIQCESVADAAVVAEPHDALGEVPIAFVVAADDTGIDEDDLRIHCANTLSYFKVPSEFIAVAEIPRTPSGKIQRHRLRRPKSSAT